MKWPGDRLRRAFPLKLAAHRHTHNSGSWGVLHESHKLTTRPLRSLAVKALRGMPPTLFNSAASRPRCKSASRHVAGPPVLFTNRSITWCLGHVGDRQIFNFTVSGAPGSTYPGRRHAAEALNGEAAKRPSFISGPPWASSPLTPPRMYSYIRRVPPPRMIFCDLANYSG